MSSTVKKNTLQKTSCLTIIFMYKTLLFYNPFNVTLRKTTGVSCRYAWSLTSVITSLSINQQYCLVQSVKCLLLHFYFVSLNMEAFVVHSARNVSNIVPATSNSSSHLRLGFLTNQPCIIPLISLYDHFYISAEFKGKLALR